MELPAGLREHPFSYRITSAGEVRVVRDGRSIVTVRGAVARKLAAQLGSDDARDQQLLARATGNYKRGNERGASAR